MSVAYVLEFRFTLKASSSFLYDVWFAFLNTE